MTGRVSQFRRRARPLLRRCPPLADLAGRAASHHLSALARIRGTDKRGYHWHTHHHQRLLGAWRRRRFNLLEIGVGGYADSTCGGESFRMWRDYCPHARIIGLGVEDKRQFARGRIEIVQGDQSDPEVLKRIAAVPGGLSIVIDEGSHIDEHVVGPFQTLFPLLNSPGAYAIEDLEFSYRHGGRTVALLQSLANAINYRHSGCDAALADVASEIAAVRLYPNLAVIVKGANAREH